MEGKTKKKTWNKNATIKRKFLKIKSYKQHLSNVKQVNI